MSTPKYKVGDMVLVSIPKFGKSERVIDEVIPSRFANVVNYGASEFYFNEDQIEELRNPADDDDIQNDMLGEGFEAQLIVGETAEDLETSAEVETALKQVAEHAFNDAVSHPSHYTSDPSGVECIEVTRHRTFAIGSAIKYLWRAGLKQDADKSQQEKQIQDLEKAVWYITDEIQRLKDSSNAS